MTFLLQLPCTWSPHNVTTVRPFTSNTVNYDNTWVNIITEVIAAPNVITCDLSNFMFCVVTIRRVPIATACYLGCFMLCVDNPSCYVVLRTPAWSSRQRFNV